MVVTVVDLSAEREKRTPHSAGRARCLACKHEWVAVAPTGVTWMECPACLLERGRFVGQHEVEGPHWFCPCGNNLYFATPEGLYCPNCGLWQVIK